MGRFKDILQHDREKNFVGSQTEISFFERLKERELTRCITTRQNGAGQDVVKPGYFIPEYDQRDFSKFYHIYSASIHCLIEKWIKDTGVAENLLQDVFLKAWRSRHHYDKAKGSIFTWLYNITRNVCIDHLRSKSHRYSKASIFSDNIPLLPEALTTVNKNPDAIGLRKVLASLNKQEQQVIELMYFLGYTQKEIAGIINIPIGTIKTRTSRAIKNLRCYFEKDWKKSMDLISLN